MDTLIVVAFLAGAVCFIVWKNKDNILSVADKFKKPEEPQAAPYKVPEPIVVVEATKPNPQADRFIYKPEEYNGVGDPPSQEAWSRWLATLDPMRRSFYPTIWKPTPVSAANPSMDVLATFNSGVADKPLTRGVRVKVSGPVGGYCSFPLAPDVTRVTIAETSEGGDRVRYNLWGSLEPNGAAAEPIREFQYNAAAIIVPAGTPFVNVRQLVASSPFYIQAN